MARGSRRGQSSAAKDSDSLKENSAPPLTQVKAEKVKSEKKTAQPSRRDLDEQDSNGDPADDGSLTQRTEDYVGDIPEDEDEDESPRSRKRARVSEEGDASETKLEKVEVKPRRVTLPRREDGYIPGSIVRVKLHNFVTYDFVEFHPGPYLNMIFGPNGTGKSSIACALCLGLNFPPSVLGRATEIGAFVKNGHTEGYIEIELRAPPGEDNIVIRRNLKAKSKSSSFTLNGVSATGKEVSERIAELNIQVGNLCSFLPQDRVSEFARMSPQQLLRETERCAGDERLTAWHDTLIQAGKDLSLLQEDLKADKEHLKTMEERNLALESQVERYHQRKEIEKNIRLLELLLPFVQYIEAKEAYLAAKDVQRALHNKLKTLSDKHKPANAFKAELTKQYNQYGKERDEQKKKVQKQFKEMGKKWDENEKLGEEAENIQQELSSLKREEKARVKKIQDLEKQIRHLQQSIDNPPEVEDMDAIQEQIRAVTQDTTAVKAKHADLQDRQAVHSREAGTHQADRTDAFKRLQELDNQAHVKLKTLEKWNRDCADAVRWLRNNQDKFKLEVLEPAYMNVTVPDTRFVHAIEANFSNMQLQTFVCQCEEDMRTLNHFINDTTEALGRRARISVWFRPKDEGTLAPPPMSPEELSQLNFDCYALDKIQCPDGMLWYLKKELNLHRMAIALDPSKVDSKAAMEAAARILPGGGSGGANYVIGRTMNQVSRSRYGKRAAQNMTREVRDARNLVIAAVDPAIKRGLEERIQMAQEALKEVEKKTAKLTEEEREIRMQMAALQKKLDDLTKRKRAILEAQSRLERNKKMKAIQEGRLAELLEQPSMDDKRADLRKRLMRVTKNRVRLVKEYIKYVRAANQEQTEATRLGLEYIQIGANLAALSEMISEKDQELKHTQNAYNEANMAYEAAKRVSKERLDFSRRKLDEADDELRGQFAVYENAAQRKTCEEVLQELDTQNAQLELYVTTNPGIVDQYERRKKEIESLSKIIEQKEKQATKLERDIKHARESWEPALQRLVASIGKKFSAAFDRIGCAGEVKVTPDDDYSKWAIDILVKFRDNEKLQLLTAQRQSGGERSLTTILYLLSLTEEARAPFSLVDEINQGMDARNEKMVHNQMVETTCRPDAAQYFLITPKLLAGLRYHKLMKVLCVNNGEWLPETQGLGNMMNMIEGFVSKRGQQGRSAV